MHDVIPPPTRRPVLRLALGVLAAVAAALLTVLYVLGTWNPWDYVVLTQNFGNPARGAAIIAVLVFLAGWLIAPIRNEAAQGRRIAVRVVSIIALALGLLCWGVLGNVLGAEVTVLSRSADGERAVALVERTADDRELRVWAGQGLTARDVGSLGIACGQVTAQFLSRDEVFIDSAYGDFRLRLDPATGAPLDRIGENCSGDG